MRVKNIKFKNIGPIESLEIDLSSNKESSPPIILFVGLNGSGKSIVLSYIADAFIEFKRQFYEDIETESTKYFKVSSSSYIKAGEEYGFCEILFDNKEYFYSEVLSSLEWENFKEKIEKEKLNIKGLDINNPTLKEYRMQKFYSRGLDLKKLVDNNILLYFPWNRTEIPAWINNEGIKISFKKMERFINRSYRNTINLGNFDELYSWILDVILDAYLYKEEHPESQYEFSLTNNLNRIIEAILHDKKYNKKNETIRFSIGKRNTGSRISIVKDIQNENGRIIQKQVSPTIFHLSSGESSLLNIFASILMDYDKQPRLKENFSLKDITGIVLIDEADLYLHMKLQTEIFPKLLKLFPNIQFIITTQSPFLLSGLQEEFQDKLKVIELPTGDLINGEEFIEFKNALNKFNKLGEKYLQEKKILQDKIKDLTKPLIITEGKTDWMILEKAKEKLSTNLNIEFHETENNLGKDNLIKMCESFSKISQLKPLIFVFDNDFDDKEKEKRRKIMDDSKGYKNWGNNVFSFTIPVPSHRKEYKNISIEMFFNDNEIKTEDQQGKRLYFTNEIEKIVNTTTNTFERYEIIQPKKEDEFNKKIFGDSIDEVEDEKGNKKVLSKTKFAEYIYTDVSPFNSFNFTEFGKIFEIIEEILKECNSV